MRGPASRIKDKQSTNSWRTSIINHRIDRDSTVGNLHRAKRIGGKSALSSAKAEKSGQSF